MRKNDSVVYYKRQRCHVFRTGIYPRSEIKRKKEDTPWVLSKTFLLWVVEQPVG